MKSQGLKKLKLPDAPGVYFWKDGKGKTLYIGRATSLRSRVRSYFADDVRPTRGSRIVDMVTRAKTIAFEKTDSVLEAIILEANLIKKFQPKYNVDEKDDKSWNYIVITDEEWPRIIVMRGRTLEKVESQKGKGESEKKIEIENISREKKAESAELSKGRGLVRAEQKSLEPRVYARSDQPEATYDFAMRLSAGDSAESCLALKKVSALGAFKNNRVFGPYPAGGLLKDALKIIRRIFPYLDEKSLDPKNRSFYASIGLSPMIGDKTSRKEYLKTIKNIQLFLEGKKKTIIKDLRKEMMQYARNEEFEKADKAKRTMYALEHIQDVSLIKSDKLNGTGWVSGQNAFRIEAYDIAHLSGKNVVGVMTVVENGEPNKDEYRKFKISKEKNDDAAALREILLRRLGHSEWPYPSLIVVDGGQIQLNVAQKVLSELKSDILAVALVKDDKHKARGILADESLTTKNPTVLAQYKRAIILANSEAHRFAISYHKNLRKRNFLK
jgi:excinuclease ABC subunit C